MNQGDRDREHFDGIADQYSAKDLVPSSRCARRHRLEHVVAHVPLQPTWRVLEIGCGAGFAATYLRGRFESYTGIDHSQELIKAAVQHNAAPNVDFVSTGIEDFQKGSVFDLVIMVGVLHHLEDRENTMKRLGDLVRPGGYLAVSEPQPSNPFVSCARRVRARLDRSYTDDQDEISIDELQDLLASAGLTDIQITPQGLFSTPFAEIPMRPDWLMTSLSRAACFADRFLEPRLKKTLLKTMAWNLTAVGRRPEANPEVDDRDTGVGLP